ncbi:MAG: hypothetical protein ACI9XB_005291 [Gammaproteobacteria bacterium]|jgi:hypothetical protein
MDMNQHNDNLEHFFRKGLKDNAGLIPENDTWDMPSDSVWEGIEGALPERKRSFPFIPIISIAPMRRLKWAFAASVLLLFSVYVGYNNQQKIETLSEEIAIQSELFQFLEEENNNNVSLQASVNIKNTIAPKPKTRLAKAVKVSTTVENELVNTFESIPFLLETREPITLVVDNSELLPFALKTITLSSNEFSFVPTEHDLPALTTISSVMVKPAKKCNRFYAGIFTGPSRWKTKIVNKVSDAFLPKGKLGKERGIETGFKLGWEIANNWSLETGISFAKNTRTVHQEKSFRFDPMKESLNADGNLQSSYDSQMSTPFGNAAMVLDVTRKPETMLTDGELFDVSFNNEFTTALIQLPLTARYNIQKGKLNLSLSAGMLLSFLQEHYIKMPEDRVGDHPMLLDEHARLKDQAPDLNNMHYAVQGGVQVAYRATENLEVYVAPTAAKSLSSVAENEETSTTLAQVGLMAGVNVRF